MQPLSSIDRTRDQHRSPAAAPNGILLWSNSCRHSPILLLLTVVFQLAMLPGCTSPRAAYAQSEPVSKVTRSEVMATAWRYASHSWIGTVANVRHGPDSTGIRVDTPDVSYRNSGAVPGYWIPGEVNHGLPYQWGGFSTPEQFDRGLAAGKAAGDVYTTQKRIRLQDAVSSEAVGIDCSGFISRCWNLPRSYSTRELAQLCDALPSWEVLQPGDALNTYNAHVLLFGGWMDRDQRELAAYETGGPPDWMVTRHVLSTKHLKAKGYHPLRYRGIREG